MADRMEIDIRREKIIIRRWFLSGDGWDFSTQRADAEARAIDPTARITRKHFSAAVSAGMHMEYREYSRKVPVALAGSGSRSLP